MTDYITPKSSGLTKEEVFKLAAQVGEKMGYKPGNSLTPHVKEIGGSIEFVSDSNINSTQDGSIVINPDKTFKIYLADDVGRNRQRFTVAHELGHYFLHYIFHQETLEMHAHRYGSGKVEWEANWFAAGLLMPETAFEQVHQECEGYLTDISDKLGVSYKAAEIRAGQLCLDVW